MGNFSEDPIEDIPENLITDGKGFRKGGSKSRLDRDWTKGGIIRNLLSLAWPMMIGSNLNMLGPTIDMIWVGKLGTASMAGVGVSGMAVMLVNSFRMGLSTGTRALVARFVGANDREGANHAAQQAIVISGAFSITTAVIGVFFSEQILTLMGLEADVVIEGGAYMRIMFIGSVAMSFRMMAEAAMQSSGDTVMPMRIIIGARIFHAVLCPFLIFGWWIFPFMGVRGAAITNVISQGVGAALALWILFSNRTRIQLTLRNFNVDGGMIWRIVRVGIPASITSAERTFANIVLTWFVVPFGTAAVAAHSLVQKVDSLVHMPVAGMGMASGILAGQNLGADQPKRAEKTGWQAAGLVTGIMFICSIGVWFWAEYLIRIFNTESRLIEIASTFIRIEIVSYLVFGLLIVLMHCLNGVGDTMVTMLTTLITMWGMQIPLAYFLTRIVYNSVYGVRWAIVLSMVLRASIYAIYFKRGRWKRKKI